MFLVQEHSHSVRQKNGFTLPSAGLHRTRPEVATTPPLPEPACTSRPRLHVKDAGVNLDISTWLGGCNVTVFWFLSNNRKRGWAAGWLLSTGCGLAGQEPNPLSNFTSTQLMLWRLQPHKTALFTDRFTSWTHEIWSCIPCLVCVTWSFIYLLIYSYTIQKSLGWIINIFKNVSKDMSRLFNVC